MSIRDSILPEFDYEMANTRKTLERIPDSTFAWRPHEKSFSMGDLASHVANIPTYVGLTLRRESFNVRPADGSRPTEPKAESSADLLRSFDRNVAEAREAIEATSDEEFLKPWSLLAGEKTLITLPRVAFLRSLILNHGIHHRAQLTVYLRMNDLPVPALYGRSADEEMVQS